MNLTGLERGDIVQVAKKGWLFFAEVEGRDKQQLKIRPISDRVTYFSATAREVVAIYKKKRPKLTKTQE